MDVACTRQQIALDIVKATRRLDDVPEYEHEHSYLRRRLAELQQEYAKVATEGAGHDAA